MNTCKATLRILSAHKLYVVIYLVLIGILVFSMSWSMLSSNAASANAATTYEPERPTVAVVDRDANRGGIADGMREYLAASSTLTDIPDDPESLQQAVASNWTDLIVIIPDGFARGMLDDAAAGQSGRSVASSADRPDVETVTSYTSGAGTMAGMTVNGFLGNTRTALVGSAAGSTRAPGMQDLDEAVDRAVAVARDKDANPAIRVTDADHTAAADATDAALNGFGTMMKTAVYPLFLAMSICSSIVLGTFVTGEVRRRLISSPQRMAVMGLQRTTTLCGFALLVCVGYLAVAFALMAAAGLDIERVPADGLVMTFCATCVYSLITVAFGFLLSECGASEVAANGVANILGLAILFTSGLSVPLSMMPMPVLALAKLLPGWWYCTAVDDALGVGTASETGVSAGAWLGGVGMVALFGVAFVCVGLAVGRIRRSRPAL
ncbi:ABC transporter permease [Bifidobacterium sp. 82T24]|uniref:ABC transporter permease n=1 Tax=Bifidobacterium pluvialisilvae TaxID=2834436 RepID=UPI001C599320|nr:ABC transporter permease [Bifidobacterium pluvialisilvae]MBW3087915.1 ABC transporter permease [Bifidobacterium pluvialisilvae]